jgi:hypothetical protein
LPVDDDSEEELIMINAVPRNPRGFVERPSSEPMLIQKVWREPRVLIEKPTSEWI